VALLCGAGAKEAHAEVMRLAEKLQSPVGHTLRGKQWIQFDNPYDVGMSGLLGYGACCQATQRDGSGCCGCRSPPPSRPSR
jgi:pyruvate dehydrogenase (quinone)